MLIRHWRITDEAGKEVKLTVTPAPPELITVSKWDIPMELRTKKCLDELISCATKFMGGNTIHKLEIEEEEV